jgi:hypothetical protein
VLEYELGPARRAGRVDGRRWVSIAEYVTLYTADRFVEDPEDGEVV